MGWVPQLAGMIAMLFFGFAVYEKSGEEIQWAIPCWLIAGWFAWNLWIEYLRDLTPWRRGGGRRRDRYDR